MSRIPVGPARDSFDAVVRATQGQDVEFIEITRAWDLQSWPHATKGYFKFKEVIPSILARMRLA